jgi:hypothetical protein
MKKQILLLIAFMLPVSAFALSSTKTYSCDVLRNDLGSPLLGDAGYAVLITGSKIDLRYTFIMSENGPVYYPMTLINQEADGAVYQADNMRAAIFTTNIDGKLNTSISISTAIGNKTYTAQCK